MINQPPPAMGGLPGGPPPGMGGPPPDMGGPPPGGPPPGMDDPEDQAEGGPTWPPSDAEDAWEMLDQLISLIQQNHWQNPGAQGVS